MGEQITFRKDKWYFRMDIWEIGEFCENVCLVLGTFP